MPSIALTPETRRLSTRVATVLGGLGYAVHRSASGVMAAHRRPTPDVGVPVCLPSGRLDPATAVDGELRAVEVPLRVGAIGQWPDRARMQGLLRALRAAGFVARLAHRGSYTVYVTTPELRARAEELLALERAAERRARAGDGFEAALEALAETETIEERRELAAHVLATHAVSLPMLASRLRHPNREVRVRALAALAVFKPLMAGRPEPSWEAALDRVRQRPPADLVEAMEEMADYEEPDLRAYHDRLDLRASTVVAASLWRDTRTPAAPARPRRGPAGVTPGGEEILRWSAWLQARALDRLDAARAPEGGAPAPSLEVALGRAAAAVLDPAGAPERLRGPALERWRSLPALTEHLAHHVAALETEADVSAYLARVHGVMRRAPHPDFYDALALDVHAGLAQLELQALAVVRAHVFHHAPDRDPTATVVEGVAELRALAEQQLRGARRPGRGRQADGSSPPRRP